MNIKKLQQTYDGLQQRERYVLAAGGVLIIIAALYLAFMPLLDRHSEIEGQHRQLQANLTWLQDQAAIVPRLLNSCSGRELAAGKDKDIISTLVRRSQLRLVSITEAAKGISLNFNGTDANRMMRLAHQIGCEGFSIQRFEVSAAGQAGETRPSEFAGVMEVQRVN